jgi:pilus assembly protein FimV
VEHYKQDQYDDDLTQGGYDDDLTSGITDYDEDFDSGDVDLFDYVDDEDSPLARLKSLILSIEWEITDTILRQFNDELQDLKGVWAGDKVNLIYLQALEKIGKYIYKEKASAHPNAIKLLLTFYTNLEKINSDDEIPANEKKSLLRKDIERFEKLKKQIASITPQAAVATPEVEREVPPPSPSPKSVVSPTREPAMADFQEEADEQPDAHSLINLKALVYGIDWEITEHDLNSLSKEVKRLEKQFAGSKVKKIFLQGIGSLGAYINLKRSDSHADAFKLLHSFFMGLETVVRDNLSGKAEKDVLLPEVEKFNVFKAAIAQSVSPQAIAAGSANVVEEYIEEGDEEEIQPAFADMPEDVRGFQEEKAAAELQERDADGLDEAHEYIGEDETAQSRSDQDDGILASEMESRLDGMFKEPELEAARELDTDKVLRGVDVETEDDDDSEEEPLPEHAGEPAPALATGADLYDEEAPAVFAGTDDELLEEPVEPETDAVGSELPGVDVEHEADDDTGEEPLPFDGDDIAPALAAEDDETLVDRKEHEANPEPDIDGTVEQFFADSFDEEQAGSADADIFAADEAEEISTGLGEEPKAEVEQELDFDPEPDSDMEPDLEIESGLEPDPEMESEEEAEAEIEAETGAAEAPADEVEDGRADFFGESDPEFDAGAMEEATQGVKVDREELFEEIGEEQDALFGGEEEHGEGFGTHEADGGFDALFEDEEGEEDEKLAEPIMPQKAITASAEEDDDFQVVEMPQGVDVEWEEDDDGIEEEPLPEEDGEIAPALAMDKDDHDDRLPVEKDDEQEVGDRFDALFGMEEDEDEAQSEAGEPVEDLLEKSVVEPSRPEGSELLLDDEAVADEKDEGAEEEFVDFAAAGFEEIWDDDIEEIPEKPDIVEEHAQDTVLGSDEEDIKALFDEAARDEHLSAGGNEIAFASGDYDEDGWAGEDIPELDAEGFATVIEDDVVTLGKGSEGYTSDDELLRWVEEEATEEEGATAIMHPEDNEDYIIGIEAADEEEEVIFEAAEESGAEAQESPECGEFMDEYDDDSFGNTLLSDNEYTKKPAEPVDEWRESTEDIEEYPDELTPLTEQEPDTSIAVGHDQALLKLADLRNCIASIGLEIDDGILAGLNEEIEKLRHIWMEKPAEKTFLQLLSTIAKHIEKYRYEADQESNRLLLSVFEKLEFTVMEEAGSAEVQEALLSETSRVLQWQARLIDRMPPSPQDSDELADEQETGSADDTSSLLGEKGTDKEFGPSLDALSRQVDTTGNDMLMEKVSTIMKSELEQFKTAFHQELRDLREEIMRGKDKE